MATTHHLALRVALGALISAAALLDPGPAPVDGPSPPAVASWHRPADAGEHDGVDHGDPARWQPHHEGCRAADPAGGPHRHPGSGSCQRERPIPAHGAGGLPPLADGPRTPWRLCGDSHRGRYAFSPAGKLLRCAPTPDVHDAPDDEWRWQPVPPRP